MNALLVALALMPAAEPEFVLHSVRDDRLAGPLVRLDADGTLQLAGSPAVAGADVVALRRRDLPSPHFPHDRPYALFANGDRLPGLVLNIVGDTVRFRADLGVAHEMRLPLSTLAALFFTERAATRAAGPDGRRSLIDKRRQDVVWLTNGDTLSGTASQLPEGGSLKLDATDVPRDRIDALLFNGDLSRARKPRGPYRLLVLRNGARLSLQSASLERGELIATTLGGAAVRVPLAEVAALNTLQGAAAYLSDAPPKRYEQTPFLDVRWPLAADRSAAGLDLRLAGGTFDKGLGLHSQCRATYALPAGAVRFEALVGLDELTGRGGAVRIGVDVDGKSLLSPFELAAADPPKDVRLPLPPQSKELTLVVEFGRGGDVRDHTDWADARVIIRR